MFTNSLQFKLADEHLQKSEIFYRNLIADSLDGILLVDESGEIRFASPSVKKILGYDAGETDRHNIFQYVHPDDRQLALSAFQDEVIKNPRVTFISIRLLKKDGEWLWCLVRGHNMLQNQHIGSIAIYFNDDSPRKNAEEALIENEKKFRQQATILNNVSDVIVTTDINRVVTSWNKVAEKLTGVAEAEAVGKLFRTILDSDYSPFTHDQVAQIAFEHGIWRGEMSFTGRDGEKKYLLHTISLLSDENGNTAGLLGIGKDITERKKIEATLQDSEFFYRNLIAHSVDGIVMIDESGRIIYSGPSVKKISGYDPGFLLGRHYTEFVHPEDVRAAGEAFYADPNKDSVLNYVHIRLKHSDGTWVWCIVRGHNLLYKSSFRSILIYFTDDTKRKEVEDKLKSSEQQFRTLIHNLGQGLLLLNDKGVVVICNRAAQEILGAEEDLLIGATSYEYDHGWDIIHEDGSSFSGNLLPGPVAIETKKSVKNTVIGVRRRATNERIWLLVNADPTLDEKGNIINVIISFSDITEQKRLSRQLIEQEIQKQKQLTQATIFGQEKERREIGKELHDNINQHLNTTRLYLEVAKEKASGEVKEMITFSHKSLTDTINEIRLMSQSLVPPTLGDLGLIESVQDLCDALRRAHTFSVDFNYRYFYEDSLPGELRLILFRIVQEQINNIIRHANASHVQIRLQSDAENIILTITDNGKGFDMRSTKRGLGFSNISNRADLFNGKVEIESTQGKGCTLTVIIPQVIDRTDTN